MILLLDNYDSFVYNLARYVRELGETPVVHRHDALTVDDAAAMAPSHIIISPGPCSPSEAGISTDLVRRLGATVPILGVCLGHQCIGAAYGGEIVRANRPMHGKTSVIHHQGVIARRPERRGQATEEAGAVMVDQRGLAVHGPPRAHDLAAVGRADALVAQAHPQDRRGGAQPPHHVG